MDDQFDLVIRKGTVVLIDQVCQLDIGIRNGKIAALGENLAYSEQTPTYEAENLVILPGMVDAHVHFNEPALGHWEGFATGSASLAAGGCTTYIDMPLNGVPPTVRFSALERKLEAAEGNSVVDYALWGGLVPGNIGHLQELAEAGVIGFKAFMSCPGGEGEEIFAEVDDLTLVEGMREIARLGLVLALHAESEEIVAKLAAQAREEGKRGALDFAATRPIAAELEAVNRALFYAEQTGCKLHFVHISSAEAVQVITDAKARGLDVTVETCPHYLVLTSADLEQLGAIAKCAPPLRTAQDQERLWQELAAGRLDLLASDHSPCPAAMKQGEFIEAWGGISSAQSSLELMLDEGHLRRDVPLPLLARLLATEPAKRFGLYPRKGQIVLGADADLALVDLKMSYTLQASDLLYRHPHSPYVGKTFGCRVKATFLRGNQVYELHEGVADRTEGAWLRHAAVTGGVHSG
ncbi:allantoinase [Paenibacillus marchantiophytorum]|uniref:Allantoinase n=1 Tax=Paenibacillus marchantiophytorum TaxID=1619310 RepID=A0ABQ1FJA5_9BACL|nr:allantoinase [Paenibacillus marchantiophytorum]GGA15655.1 allantoinase [Paenibacillus marchantiophytorum]